VTEQVTSRKIARSDYNSLAAAVTALQAQEPVAQAVIVDEAAGLANENTGRLGLARDSGGLFLFDDSDLSALVAADTANGIYVAPTSDETGASGAWVRQFWGAVNPCWFGVSTAGTGAANSAALEIVFATLRARGVAGYLSRGVEKIVFPHGIYNFSDTIELTGGSWIIEGEGPPTDESGATLKFAAGVVGIRVHDYNTQGAVVRSAGERANYSEIRNLRLGGAYTGTEDSAHGIHLRARAVVVGCKIQDFGGNGVHVTATAGGGGADEGNANLFEIRNTRAVRCTTGLYVDGADANAGLVQLFDASSNRRWGIWDASFLGNTYVACHADANGFKPNTVATTVTYSGKRYSVRHFQEAGASTNAPSGTTANNTWWYYIGAGGEASWLNIFEWANGTTYRSGGAYCMDSGNAVTVLDNCYAEGSQPASQIDGKVLVVGGLHTETGIIGIYSGTAWGGWIRVGSDEILLNNIEVDGTLTIDRLLADLKIGYAAFTGGSVTQLTNKSTGVTLNKPSGRITLNNTTLAAGASVSFTLSNTSIADTDVVLVNITAGASANSYEAQVTAVNHQSCRIQLRNISGGDLSEAVVLTFATVAARTA